MKVYIAGPYTRGDVAQNVHNAIMVADEILGLGHTPYVPHLTHFWHLISPKPWQTWMEIDLVFLSLCDCLLRIDGESEGADKEVERAKVLGMPIYYSKDEIPR